MFSKTLRRKLNRLLPSAMPRYKELPTSTLEDVLWRTPLLHHTTARISVYTASKQKQRGVNFEVPKYGGLASVQLLRWIKQVGRAADALNIDDDEIRVSFAMSHLTGRAEDWAWGLTCEDGFTFANFDDFIEQLKAAFLPANSDFRIYPSTFQDAVCTAVAEEFSVLQSRTTTKTRGPHDMEVSVMASPTTDRRCFNCNRPGHFSCECRQPRRAPTSARGTASSPAPRFAHPVVNRARAVASFLADGETGLLSRREVSC
ncbi:hypothetical protein DYB31_016246 [Aphanomyces astaci]|uniref:CCHC-type domain-containing protein n=1 Tax=Aphanomyces astaci TaxID=112090 RepID=A0A397FLY7_APHAT|nr:hypothetical protein DYB31_016246 [Aphanomyces astaci]